MLRGESGRILRELFEFGDLTASQVMVPRVRLVGIPVGAEVDELRQIVRDTPFTRYPIYVGDFDHIIGSIHIKRVLRHLVAGRPTLRAAEQTCRSVLQNGRGTRTRTRT